MVSPLKGLGGYPMGKVKAYIKLANFGDEAMAERGLIRESEVRSIRVEALVDTGATLLVIPKDVADALGLKEWKKVKVTYGDNRTVLKPVVRGISVEILGRDCVTSAVVEEESKQILVGQVVIEELDLIVDPKKGVIGPRPESPDMPLVEILRQPSSAS